MRRARKFSSARSAAVAVTTGLVSRFMGQPVPATGFSIGVSRLMTALKNLGKLSGEAASGPILVTIMDRDRIGDYARRWRKSSALRSTRWVATDSLSALTVPVELFQGNPKDFPKQLRYADRRGSPIAIIQGGNEKEAEGKLIVKDLIEGKRIAETITDNAEWREAKAGEHLVDESRSGDYRQACSRRTGFRWPGHLTWKRCFR
jgi:histidyl-tRNA synthetase